MSLRLLFLSQHWEVYTQREERCCF
jgi:hypothetical protein